MTEMLSNSDKKSAKVSKMARRSAAPSCVETKFTFLSIPPLSEIADLHLLRRSASHLESPEVKFYNLLQKRVRFFVTLDMVRLGCGRHGESTGFFAVDLREWFNLFYRTSIESKFDGQTYFPLQVTPFFRSKPKGVRSTLNDMSATTFAIGNAFNGAWADKFISLWHPRANVSHYDKQGFPAYRKYHHEMSYRPVAFLKADSSTFQQWRTKNGSSLAALKVEKSWRKWGRPRTLSSFVSIRKDQLIASFSEPALDILRGGPLFNLIENLP
jgi:hypothetical protein